MNLDKIKKEENVIRECEVLCKKKKSHEIKMKHRAQTRDVQRCTVFLVSAVTLLRRWTVCPWALVIFPCASGPLCQKSIYKPTSLEAHFPSESSSLLFLSLFTTLYLFFTSRQNYKNVTCISRMVSYAIVVQWLRCYH
jgi:hypothetical protein